MADDQETQATVIHLLAGQSPDGELIFEDVPADNIGDGCHRLLQSPVFAEGQRVAMLFEPWLQVALKLSNMAVTYVCVSWHVKILMCIRHALKHP